MLLFCNQHPWLKRDLTTTGLTCHSTVTEHTHAGRMVYSSIDRLSNDTGGKPSLHRSGFNGSSGVMLCKLKLKQCTCCLDCRSVSEQQTFRQNFVRTMSTFVLQAQHCRCLDWLIGIAGSLRWLRWSNSWVKVRIQGAELISYCCMK